MTLNYGWGKINGAWQVAFEDSFLGYKFKNIYTPLPADTGIAFSYGVMERLFTMVNIRFKTQADAETFIANIVALQKTGTPFSVEWQVNSGGAAGDFFAFDGSVRSMNCLCENITNFSKEAKGDQTIYKVQRVMFKEGNK